MIKGNNGKTQKNVKNYKWKNMFSMEQNLKKKLIKL